jgi:hypothetical protein
VNGLLIDRLREAAEHNPAGLLAPGLGNARAWAESGGIASWLVAQGYGPGGKALTTGSRDPVLMLGALRAGALISAEGVPLPAGVRIEALAGLPVDAAVAERRLHITAETPALRRAEVLLLQRDVASLADLL